MCGGLCPNLSHLHAQSPRLKTPRRLHFTVYGFIDTQIRMARQSPDVHLTTHTKETRVFLTTTGSSLVDHDSHYLSSMSIVAVTRHLGLPTFLPDQMCNNVPVTNWAPVWHPKAIFSHHVHYCATVIVHMRLDCFIKLCCGSNSSILLSVRMSEEALCMQMDSDEHHQTHSAG